MAAPIATATSTPQSFEEFVAQYERLKTETNGYQFPQTKPSGDPMQTWHDTVRSYDTRWCTARNEDINTLLTFAALFSAVVTAFIVESYKWLSPEPGSTPSASSRSINIFWFLSLTLSLLSGLVGIHCKQWLQEYQRDATDIRSTIAIRHVRWESWQYWKADAIIASLPVLLQIALALFLIGVAQLLLVRDTVVAAIVTTVITASLLAIFFLTTLLPGILAVRYPVNEAGYAKRFCSYRSPQSLFVLRLLSKYDSWRSMETELLSKQLSKEAGESLFPATLRGTIRTNKQMLRVNDALLGRAKNWIHTNFKLTDDVLNGMYHIHQPLFRLLNFDDTQQAAILANFLYRSFSYLPTRSTPLLRAHFAELWYRGYGIDDIKSMGNQSDAVGAIKESLDIATAMFQAWRPPYPVEPCEFICTIFSAAIRTVALGWDEANRLEDTELEHRSSSVFHYSVVFIQYFLHSFKHDAADQKHTLRFVIDQLCTSLHNAGYYRHFPPSFFGAVYTDDLRNLEKLRSDLGVEVGQQAIWKELCHACAGQIYGLR